MSLGFSLGDFRTIGERSWKVYKACRGASSEFQEIATEVLSLHAVLKLLQDASEDSNSLISRAADSKKLEVYKILRICRRMLDAIDNLVTKYHSLGTDKERKWYILGHGTAELDHLRRKLKISVSNLDMFLNSLETTSLARIESLMEKLLLEVRAGRRTPSVLSSVIENATVGWPLLKTELAGVGVPKADIEMYKEPIQEWIREADEDGILEEAEPREDPAPPRQVHLRRLSFRAPPSSILSAGEVIVSQPITHTTQHPVSMEAGVADEDQISSSTLSVGGAIVSQPTSPTAEYTEDSANDILDEARIARNISFSDPVPLPLLSFPRNSGFSTESSEAIESISADADKTGPIMPEAHAEIEPHVVTSNTTRTVLDIVGEVISHTAPPESTIPPQKGINLIPEEPSENAPPAKGYVVVDAMSSSPPNPSNAPPSSHSNNLYQPGRQAPPQGFLAPCLGRCKDDPYDTRYLIEEEIRTVR